MSWWNPTVGEFLKAFPHRVGGFGLGVAGITCPIWIPFAEGRGWTLPRNAAEVATYIAFMIVGAVVLWVRWRTDDPWSSD